MEPAGGFCPVYDAITVLQEKWTMHIVRALLPGPLGFNELGRAVGGCNPATLKARLDGLEQLGLVSRTVVSYMPPRTLYELAPAGEDLQRVIDAIDTWARKHLTQPRLRHPEVAAAPAQAL
ncbi:MAG TPA: helix-turn-helix domain-containing protein [Candidatus Dormibacteraeota bacterium]